MVTQVTMFLAGIWGFFLWIGNLSLALARDNALGFVIGFTAAPIYIPFLSVGPFFILAIWIFPIALVLYGVYWIINQIVTSSN